MTQQEKDKILQYVEDNQRLSEQLVILLDGLVREMAKPQVALEAWERFDSSEAIDEASEQVEKGFKAQARMNAHMYKYISKILVEETEI